MVVTVPDLPATYGQVPRIPAGHPREINNNVNMDTEAIIAIVFTFSTIFGVVYIIMTARHRERMAMIGRGLDPGLGHKPDPLRALKQGMQLVAVAVGMGLGDLLGRYTDMRDPWSYLAPVLFCLGLVSLIYYYLRTKERG